MEVRDGLLPDLAAEGMVGEPFDPLGQALRSEVLEGLHNARVQGTPTLLQQAAVGHLMGQGVLEGILALGKEARLVEELGSLQVGETAMQRLFGNLSDSLQQG